MIRRLWRSTFGIVVLVALAFAAATLAIGAVAYEVTHEALEEQLDHRVAVETRALVAEASEGALPGLPKPSACARRRATKPASTICWSTATGGRSPPPSPACAARTRLP